MTEQEIKEQIAIIDGWQKHPEFDGYWISPSGAEFQVMYGWNTYKDGTDIIPDYFSKDEILDVVRRHIKNTECFIQELVTIMDEHYSTDDTTASDCCTPIELTATLLINLSGKDYCEAFLRCMGKKNNDDHL